MHLWNVLNASAWHDHWIARPPRARRAAEDGVERPGGAWPPGPRGPTLDRWGGVRRGGACRSRGRPCARPRPRADRAGLGGRNVPAADDPARDAPERRGGRHVRQRLPAVGRARPTTLRVTRGHVPSGLVLTGAGILRGRPSARGIWRFTVTAFAPGGSTAGSRGYRLAIAAAPPKALRPARPVIGPQSLPAAQLDEQYTGQLTVRGPSPPYTLRVTNGALPVGLTVSPTGRLSGMPSEPGKCAFTVSAFKRGRYVAFRDYTLAVEGVGPRALLHGRLRGRARPVEQGGYAVCLRARRRLVGPGRGDHGRADDDGPASGQSELASLWLDWPAAHATNGKSTWYAAKVMFPTSYEATTGQWNWFIVWHIDDATWAYPGTNSPALGIFTDYPVGSNRGRNPRLAFRVNGGSVDPTSDEGVHNAFQHPRAGTVVRPPRPFRLVTERRDRPGGAVDRRSPARRMSLPTLYSHPERRDVVRILRPLQLSADGHRGARRSTSIASGSGRRCRRSSSTSRARVPDTPRRAVRRSAATSAPRSARRARSRAEPSRSAGSSASRAERGGEVIDVTRRDEERRRVVLEHVGDLAQSARDDRLARTPCTRRAWSASRRTRRPRGSGRVGRPTTSQASR